jgi:hypothetical protein
MVDNSFGQLHMPSLGLISQISGAEDKCTGRGGQLALGDPDELVGQILNVLE